MIPLSFAQQRLWFLHKFEGPSAAYNIPLALNFDGSLNAGALQAAIGDVLERHESLRTIFTEIDGVGQQHILQPDAVGSIFQIAPATDATLGELLREAVGYCFDLAREPPIRATLFRLGDTRHTLLLLVHHICADGWSLAPLLRDLATAYTTRCRGQASSWAPLPVQYADYTLWQREWLGEESDPDSAIAAQIAFWKQTLAGLPEQIVLPADRPRPTRASYRGAVLNFAIGAGVQKHLIELVRSSQTSLFMVLHAAIAVLLSRLGAGTDIPLGTAIAGRTDDSLDDLVGFFVNTLVLRTDLSGNPSFRELLARVRATDLAAYSHQDLPFERLVEIVNPARAANHHPLFQVMLTLQNNAAPTMDLPGLAITGHAVDLPLVKFDLQFSFGESFASDGAPQGIFGLIDYATDLFDRSTIESIAQRLVRVLTAVAEAIDDPIGSIDLLGPDERERILLDWNATTHPVADATLPELFGQQVARTPDAVALVFEDATLT
ncbi:MAG TPA: condensation domain-containing protein, partial [Xanthomonadaceae bacterium]|nr:condensation domain-containing protein [Xanthomonadaceae bacterium]